MSEATWESYEFEAEIVKNNKNLILALELCIVNYCKAGYLTRCSKYEGEWNSDSRIKHLTLKEHLS